LKEEEVKKALSDYLENRAGAKWVNRKTTKPKSETGWDLVYSRKNMVLYIEAKGIEGQFDGPFISSIGAIMMRRGQEVLSKRNTPRWCENYCLAFNSDRKNKYDLIRALFYKLTAPDCLKNWDLIKKAGAKYLFLIRNDKKVLKLRWDDVTKLANEFTKEQEKNLHSRGDYSKNLKIIEKMFDSKKWE
jgi:hypothetical protein